MVLLIWFGLIESELSWLISLVWFYLVFFSLINNETNKRFNAAWRAVQREIKHNWRTIRQFGADWSLGWLYWVGFTNSQQIKGLRPPGVKINQTLINQNNERIEKEGCLDWSLVFIQSFDFINEINNGPREADWALIGFYWFDCKKWNEEETNASRTHQLAERATAAINQNNHKIDEKEEPNQAVLTQLKFLFNWRTVKPYKDKVYDNSKDLEWNQQLYFHGASWRSSLAEWN